MINLTSHSAHIITHSHTTPYVVTDNTNPSLGLLRNNGGQMQVFNGVWTTSNIETSVGLTGDAEKAIEWAIRQMHRERRLKEMADRHPAVADVLVQRDRAEEALNIVLRLCGELE